MSDSPAPYCWVCGHSWACGASDSRDEELAKLRDEIADLRAERDEILKELGPPFRDVAGRVRAMRELSSLVSIFIRACSPETIQLMRAALVRVFQ